MKPWPSLTLPPISFELPQLSLKDSRKGLTEIKKARFFSMYVCGITPYDATHLGHAATYLSFDLINRYLTLEHTNVNFVENVTDIDDPLLERSVKTGQDWKTLATDQLNLFKSDMSALRVLPPDNLVKVTDSMNLIESFISDLTDKGFSYEIDGDLYFSVSDFIDELPVPQDQAIEIFRERGGDPDRVGKRHPLDPILWLANKDNEPGWNSKFGYGRPGWHVECTAIAMEYLDREELGSVINLQGGGSDLLFPHHFMSSVLIKAATSREFAQYYVHAGMVGLNGEKMSKSKGNLIFVSKLLGQDVDPVVIRWALLSDHYQDYREWNDQLLLKSKEEVEIVRAALSKSEVVPVRETLMKIASAISNNLDTPSALKILLNWAKLSLQDGKSVTLINEAGEMSRGLDSLLGLTF
jgi:L-cysteine:1D-myo-inositol 2-amino-2-deoxy-alpha-D-glucopyranoside ligase